MFTAPPVFQVSLTVSKVPPFTLMVSMLVGSICSPPMFAIFPQDTALNSLGPLPDIPISAVAYAESHAIEDLNAARYGIRFSEPPLGSGATLPISISPFKTKAPS